MKVKDITNHLEAIAPRSYQESYDNAGLLTGSSGMEVNGVLLTLDVTEAIIDEAIDNNINLIVAHHPLIFKGLKKLTGQHWVERCTIKAIKNDIAIYAIHTNLDHVHMGVNKKIAEKLGLQQVKILDPKKDTLMKLVTFVPEKETQNVLDTLYKSGAGAIGNYDHCSFQVEGTGTFRPGEGTNPHIGTNNQEESVSEKRIEVVFPGFLSEKIINALKESHPYEEVAYYLQGLINENQEVGAGMIGYLSKPMKSGDFLSFLKDIMKTNCVRHTAIYKEEISKVAVCGGAGSFLLKKAMMQQADIFITGDFKYHEFFEADNKIIIADIGHYESEQFTKDLLYEILRQKFTNIALRLSEVETNPIKYL